MVYLHPENHNIGQSQRFPILPVTRERTVEMYTVSDVRME